MIDYGHNDRWPANTWIALYVETYNRGPVLPSEIQPYLEKLGLDVFNPESGFLSVFGESLVEFNEEQEIGRSAVFVRDSKGTMTKARLLEEFKDAPWTPVETGPHMPSVSYWPRLSDDIRDSQDLITNLWRAQEGGTEAFDFARFMGTALKFGLFASVGVVLYGLYRRVSGSGSTRAIRSRRSTKKERHR